MGLLSAKLQRNAKWVGRRKYFIFKFPRWTSLLCSSVLKIVVSLLGASFMGKLLLLLTSVTKLDNKKYFHKTNKLQDLSREFPGSHFLFIFRKQRKWSNRKENSVTFKWLIFNSKKKPWAAAGPLTADQGTGYPAAVCLQPNSISRNSLIHPHWLPVKVTP